MLTNLHVKNLALINEADIDLYPGLNIMSGETGAGKSLLLGSVNLALGAKAGAAVVGKAGDHALVELTFQIENGAVRQELLSRDIDPDGDMLTISRKITGSKSIFRINGETVNSAAVKNIASYLLDIHGQHDHQSLLYPSKQLEILDKYAGAEAEKQKASVKNAYIAYKNASEKLDSFTLDEESRIRELSFLQYEIDQIDSAAVREGEEEELSLIHKKMSNSRQIAEALDQVHSYTGYESGAGDLVSRAITSLSSVSEYDESLKDIAATLSDIEGLLNDVNRSAAGLQSEFDYSEQDLFETEKRLDEIRDIQARYGRTCADINAYREKACERAALLENYAEEKLLAEKALEKARDILEKECGQLSKIRKAAAEKLTAAITGELKELNFAGVVFEIAFEKTAECHENGFDSLEFLISANPGEPIQPLAKVASGGELSRIMLAIKSILSEKDPSETLIFDEIDAGISGRTAAKIASKLLKIAAGHQVLCITHLPQIAAMADRHFLIEKNVAGGETHTEITLLDDEGMIMETARLLGGEKITPAAVANARELRALKPALPG